jgi:hypothetical protein
MTKQEIESKLSCVENMIAKATHPQDLASLNQLYNRLLDKLVEMDLDESKKSNRRM